MVDLPSSINQTLSRFSSPKFMSFELDITRQILAPQIDSWIDFAMSRDAENLSLIVRAEYSFPDFFFVNASLKTLSLTLARTQYRRLRYEQDPFFDLMPGCTVSWSSLKELTLSSCNIHDESIANILSGCSLLETLILDLCTKLNRLDLSKSVKLRRLEISLTPNYLHIRVPIEIVAPQIRYLKLTNLYKPKPKLTLVNVSSLTEAYFNLSYDSRKNLKADFLQVIVLKMLATLQNVEKLTIPAVVLQILSLTELRGVPFPTLKIKALTVETTIVQSVLPGITRLLQNSPELKKIAIHTMKCKAIADKELDRYLEKRGLDPYKCWCGFFPRWRRLLHCSMVLLRMQNQNMWLRSWNLCWETQRH